LLAWDTCARVEDFDRYGVAACIQVEVHGWCDFAGDEMALSGSRATLDEDDHKSVGLRIICQFHLPGDSTSPEALFSMIGVEDLPGRHCVNIPASVYIANIPSVERGMRVVPVGNSGTVHLAGLFTWKRGAHVSRFDSCRHSRATVSASPSASCCAATLVRVAAHRNRFARGSGRA